MTIYVLFCQVYDMILNKNMPEEDNVPLITNPESLNVRFIFFQFLNRIELRLLSEYDNRWSYVFAH